ncbi:MAG TPA: hypothetical protein VG934_01050 [Candidatus Paceibacterota bacterium]|nr:hypothetical protein [Candidatus Paceibacterota bacterium]
MQIASDIPLRIIVAVLLLVVALVAGAEVVVVVTGILVLGGPALALFALAFALNSRFRQHWLGDWRAAHVI